MAYLDLTQFRGDAVGAPQDLKGSPTADLTVLEWQVVALAQRDRLSSLEGPSRMAKLLRVVFGGERANPRLADPRLEALRRVSVLAWHKGYAVPAHETAAFHEAGYTVGQLELVLASISRGRSTLNGGRTR